MDRWQNAASSFETRLDEFAKARALAGCASPSSSRSPAPRPSSCCANAAGGATPTTRAPG
eukprot:11608803-Alexandrium_andersonii.AAC.1